MKKDVNAIIAEMTIEEKSSLCSGFDFWHTKGLAHYDIPSIMMADGPHGLRKQTDSTDHLGIYDSEPATCFPALATLACSWDVDLLRDVGVALGEEAQAKGVSVVLGPGVNIKRSPLGGRNFEYLSEDPYVTATLATHYVQGVQSQGIGTSLKHFAVNNQEHRRMTVDALVDERTLREIYLASFEAVVKEAKPWTVMCSYNKVNGYLASENPYLLGDILRGEWGHEGIVVSDWGAVSDRVEGLKAGMELEMPSTNGINDQYIAESVRNGLLDEAVLDRAVKRILHFLDKVVAGKKADASYDEEAHHELARRAAEESIVLLKNEADILPLHAHEQIAVIGQFAKEPRIQGGGSSRVNPAKMEAAFDVIEDYVENGDQVHFAAGYALDHDQVVDDYVEEACQLAKKVDKVLLFVGLPEAYESEGYDRDHMNLPASHEKLIEEVTKVNDNVLVLLSNGSPIEMPWIGQVKGIVECYLAGQASGRAICNILFGQVNPSGKLAETFPVKLADNPSFLHFPGEGDQVVYREGLYVGYRYYDKKQLDPLFPFGFGLSYTTFTYSDLELDKQMMKDTEEVNLSLTIENSGTRPGAEIVQLYVRPAAGIIQRPEKELKAFAKVYVQAGEKQTVHFTLDKAAFAYYDLDTADWQVESGKFTIELGASSRDIRLSKQIYVESTKADDFIVGPHTLLGDILKHPKLTSLALEHLASLQATDIVGDLDPENDDAPNMMESMLLNMPLRAAVNFTQGMYSKEMMMHTIQLFNDQLQENE